MALTMHAKKMTGTHILHNAYEDILYRKYILYQQVALVVMDQTYNNWILFVLKTLYKCE